MKYIIFLTIGIYIISSSYAKTIRVVHYNIKEMDSRKISDNDSQIGFVHKILNQKSFDILSLNEIQYDMENVPSSVYKTNGQNVEELMKKFNLTALKYQSFHPANTGENAKKQSNGSYFISPNTPLARKHADQLNFGVMPGQYSTAGRFRYKVINEKIIKNLKWKDFNPSADFSSYRTPDGKKIPENMKLFDKNFSDISLDIDGRTVHIVLLHTVPSYNFGNKKSINMFRNSEQLKFLEWYLTANTDFKVNLKGIRPLKSQASFIAMGDFNVDVKSKNQLGGNVLRRLFGKTNPWMPIKKMSFTNDGSNFNPKNQKLLLDYIITSRDIKTLKGEIMHPSFERYELGCKPKVKDTTEMIRGNIKKYIKVDYKKAGKTCYAYVLKDQYYYRRASDHYPLYGEFEIK